jgi:hypothetical protein
MALLTISGEPASRWEEAAHGAAQLLKFELITEARLDQWIREEFGEAAIPERAWRSAVVSIIARLATEHHLVIAVPGAEALFAPMPMLLRAAIVASEARRVGNLMVDRRVERPEARKLLAAVDKESRARHRARFGSAKGAFDVALNADQMEPSQIAEVVRAAVCSRGLIEQGLLSSAAEAQMQFQTRIQWQYEPRSFPLQWDKDGNVTEAFTPDFYLPEFDQYVELTTMKQAHVTKKNRKIKLLRAIYPHVNIQVFYQKDFQDLVFKYGLSRD